MSVNWMSAAHARESSTGAELASTASMSRGQEGHSEATTRWASAAEDCISAVLSRSSSPPRLSPHADIASQTPHQVQRVLSMDLAVGERVSVLELLARKDETLLVGWDPLRDLDLARDSVAQFCCSRPVAPPPAYSHPQLHVTSEGACLYHKISRVPQGSLRGGGGARGGLRRLS